MQTITKSGMLRKISVFADRKAELKELLASANALSRRKPQNFVILGPRRIGKTHLIIKYLLESSSKSRIPICIDTLFLTSWAEVADMLVSGLLHGYREFSGKRIDVDAFFIGARAKATEFREKMKSVEAEFGATAGYYVALRASMEKKNEVNLLINALKILHEFAEKKKITLIVVIDEIQQAAKFANSAEGLAAIRSEMQFHDRIQYIFSGSSPTFMREEFLRKGAALWKQVTPFEMREFPPEGVEELLRAFHPAARHDESCIRRIHEITQGIPDYVVKTLNRMGDTDRISVDDVDSAFEKVVESEIRFIQQIMDELTPDQIRILGTMTGGTVRYKEIAALFEYPPTALLRTLEKEELIAKTGRGEYVIRDPVLRAALERSRFPVQ